MGNRIMCKHLYHHDIKKTCPLPEYYARWEECRRDGKVPEKLLGKVSELPVDNQQKCIFHSEDLDFKKQHKHLDLFKNLTGLLSWSIAEKLLDVDRLEFEDFIFIGEADSLGDEIEADEVFDQMQEQEIINFAELSVSEYIFFRNVRFLSDTWFGYANFVRAVFFENCSFFGDVDFGECKFEQRVNLLECVFEKDAGFRETLFHSYADFFSCRFQGTAAFNGTVFNDGASFRRGSFSKSYFTGVTFQRGVNQGLVSFEEVYFGEDVRFEETEFNEETSFKGAKFGKAEFTNVGFSSHRVLNFDHITVDETLLFKSLTPANKLFKHAVSLEVNSDDIRGSIIFENANVYLIQQQEIVRRLSSPSVRKLVIGPGCDKYRFKREVEIPMTHEWRPIIMEMAQTFVEFFGWQGKIIIGVNVECEFLVDSVLVRYYTDTDITDAQFDHLLSEKVPQFIEFLKDPDLYFQRHLESNRGELSNLKSMIKGFDVYRKIKSLGIGLLPRINRDPSWRLEDTDNLLKAIGQQANQNVVIEFHQHFTQLDLLSFGTRKYLSGRDITIQSEE